MFRFILPTILIGSAITGFFLFDKPIYEDVNLDKEQISSYNEALDNSKSLEAERDKLTAKYNKIDPVNLAKLQKLLPDNVDNIRLILEVENIAKPFGMVLKNVKYDSNSDSKDTNKLSGTPQSEKNTNKNYGIWDLEFTTEGTYNNFISFVKELENNLRIVDISSIDFASNENGSVGVNPSLPQAYKYNFKIRTYWLKN